MPKYYKVVKMNTYYTEANSDMDARMLALNGQADVYDGMTIKVEETKDKEIIGACRDMQRIMDMERLQLETPKQTKEPYGQSYRRNTEKQEHENYMRFDGVQI